MTDIVEQLRALARAEHDDLSVADEAADTIEQLRARIEYLEKRLEVVPGWSEDADGIACRDETIRLQDERNTRQQARIAELEGALEPFAKMGEMANFAFAPALFSDTDGIKELPWSENGEPVTITYGDLRRAAAIRERTDGR